MHAPRQPVDLATWPRREHFAFFRAFSEPFFGVTVEIPCEGLHRASRERGRSFWLSYLHATMQAVNAVDALALRIDGDGVWRHERVDVSATVDRADGTFGFSFIPYDPDFDAFAESARAEVARVRGGTGLQLPATDAAVVHASAVPWVRFTALSHARQHGTDDASPKIAFGRVFERDGGRVMPVSIHVHHAVADGRDVGQLVAEIERRFDP